MVYYLLPTIGQDSCYKKDEGRRTILANLSFSEIVE
jgi:hypothetical protein